MPNKLEIDYMEFLVGRLFDYINLLRSSHANTNVTVDILDQIILTSTQITDKARAKKAELGAQKIRQKPSFLKFKQAFLDSEHQLDPEAFGGEDYPSV